MDKRKKIIFAALAAVILIAGIFAGIGISAAVKGNKDNGKGTAENAPFSENTIASTVSTDSSSNADVQKENEKIIAADFVKTNTWESGGKKYAQIDVTVKNNGSSKITDWTMCFNLGANANIEQSWNCGLQTSKNGTYLEIEMKPVEYNQSVEAGAQTQGIGFIFSADSDIDVGDYKLAATVDGVTVTEEMVASAKEEQSEAPENQENIESDDNQSSENDSENNYQNNETNNDDNALQPDAPSNDYMNTTVVSGRLHVEGSSIVDAGGNKVQLRGVSTHGLAWFPEYVNYDAFQTLRDDWGANVVRLAMYTAEYGGYCNGGDRNALLALIDAGVNYASQLDMYVIIDWHILSDGNPYQHKDEAVAFFSEISSKYAGYSNVIYEICNEPQNSDWNSVIKPYAEEVLSAIRSNTDALVIVGTNTWSQDVDAVIGNKIDDANVCYALHFYAATHKDAIRNKLISAMDNGVPVFVSECSICDASGNGGIDYGSADEWLNLLNSRGVSFLAWSLCNKAETASLIQSGCSKTSGWSEDDLSETGKWFRNAIRQ